MDAQETAGAAAAGCCALLVVGLGIDLAFAWVLQQVLGAFGLHPGYWVCFGIVMLVSFLFGGASRASSN